MTSMSIQQRHMHHPAPWVLCGFLLSVYDSSFPKEPTGTHNPVEQCEGARGVLRVLRLHLPSRNYSQRSVASKNGHGCAIASRYIRGTKVTALFGDLFFCIYIYIYDSKLWQFISASTCHLKFVSHFLLLSYVIFQKPKITSCGESSCELMRAKKRCTDLNLKSIHVM